MAQKLSSRKLIISLAGIAGIVGETLGIAVIEPSLFETATTELRFSYGLIASIAGAGTYLQHLIDKNNG